MQELEQEGEEREMEMHVHATETGKACVRERSAAQWWTSAPTLELSLVLVPTPVLEPTHAVDTGCPTCRSTTCSCEELNVLKEARGGCSSRPNC